MRLVDREPSQLSPSRPPPTAMYVLAPIRRPPNVSASPAARDSVAHIGCGSPLRRGSKSAPVIAITHGRSATSWGPRSVHSSEASFGSFPASRFAARRAKRSMAPPGGTPDAIAPGRPRSWIVVSSPGSTPRRTSIKGGREELHSIARPEEARRIGVGEEQPHRAPADQVPTAWNLHRIDTCLPAGDRNRAGGHMRPRHAAARQRGLFRERGAIRAPWYEAHEADAIDGARMPRDELAGGQSEGGRGPRHA